MGKSEVLHEDHEQMIALYKRMKPEEKLMAFFHHSQLINQLYQAGTRYRAGSLPPSHKKLPKKR